MKFETSIALPIANAIRVVMMTNFTGIIGIISESSTFIPGADISPQKLLSYLREVQIVDNLNDIIIADVSVAKGPYSRKSLIEGLGVTVKRIDSVPIGMATEPFKLKILLGQHSSLAPLTRDKVVQKIKKEGYSVEKSVLVPFPILSNEVIKFLPPRDLGDGFTQIHFDGVDEAYLLRNFIHILEQSNK